MLHDPIAQFESAFAHYQGAESARAFWMGRIGLFAVLKALGVREDDNVGICAYTCVGVVEAVTRLRARPVFLDVDDDMNIDPAAIERTTRPMKALILQHTFGVPCDIRASLDAARRAGVPVIEDCCHSLGALVGERRVGTFAPAAVFSFQWGKPYSTGQGGMATFQDSALAEQVTRICQSEGVAPSAKQNFSLSLQRMLFRYLVTPRTRKWLKAAYKTACRIGVVSGSEPSSADLIGNADGFLRGSGAGQGAAGIAGMQTWPERLRKRNAAAAEWIRRFRDAGISVRAPRTGDTPMYLRVPVRVRKKDELLHRADAENLDIAGWYSTPAHPFTGKILEELGYDARECPNAERAFREVVTVPTWPVMNARQMDRAVTLVREAL